MTDLLLDIPEENGGDPPEFSLATVAEVGSIGIRLIFDGQSEASRKYYKCNSQVNFSAGDRVKICKDSGTYIVEYPVGAPRGSSNPLPSGGIKGQLLAKSSNSNYAVEWIDNQLVSGSYSVSLKSTILTPSASTISLGSAVNPFSGLYALGNVALCSAKSKISFFGATPAARREVADDAKVSTLISALKAYGLIA